MSFLVPVISALDVMTLVAENASLKCRIEALTTENLQLRHDLQHARDKNNVQQKYTNHLKTELEEALAFNARIAFTPENVECTSGRIKLFKYYTGFSYQEFINVYKCLIPAEFNSGNPPFKFSKKTEATRCMSLSTQLFLVLCKLRNNFDMIDLGFRFSVSQQDISVLFSDWMNYMFFRLGELPLWPARDTVQSLMPTEFKTRYPTTMCMIDCTEIKIQKPKSLVNQSATYSDYKSSNTVKGLVAVDPRGSLLFASMLFAGSLSDKEIFLKSHFKKVLENLIEKQTLHKGDSVMADKGFTIKNELLEIGLNLNMPPFAKCGKKFTSSEVVETEEIARWRVHVERHMAALKKFKILSGKFPLSLFAVINQVWFVCNVLTLFQPPIIRS